MELPQEKFCHIQLSYFSENAAAELCETYGDHSEEMEGRWTLESLLYC